MVMTKVPPLQQIAAKGHSDQDLQPKYAKHRPGASKRWRSFPQKGRAALGQVLPSAAVGQKWISLPLWPLGFSYILVKGAGQSVKYKRRQRLLLRWVNILFESGLICK